MPEFSRELYSFVEIANCQSLREAAERLNIASSALSRQMSLLESDLGVQLLIRNVRGVQLTDHGQTVLRQARKWLEDGNQLRAELSDMTFDESDKIRVGSMECFARTLMPKLFDAVSDAGSYARMDVRISDTETLLESLRDNTLDLVIAFNAQQSHSVRLLSVIPCQIGLVYSKNHFDKVPAEISIGDCLDWPICLPGEDLSLHPRLYAEILKQRKKPNIVASSSAIDFIRELVVRGNGVSFLTWFDVQEQVENGELDFVPLVEKRLTETLCVCASGNVPMSKAQRRLAKQAKNLISMMAS